MREAALAGRERQQVLEPVPQASAVVNAVVPQVHTDSVTEGSQMQERGQVEDAVVPCACPFEFARLAAVAPELPADLNPC